MYSFIYIYIIYVQVQLQRWIECLDETQVHTRTKYSYQKKLYLISSSVLALVSFISFIYVFIIFAILIQPTKQKQK